MGALPPLPDIYDVKPVDADDDAVFAEVRAVLESHGALQRFGLTLLHQHFPMSDDEVLIEHIDVENRVLVNRPFPAAGRERAIETSWRLDDPSAQRRCETMCQPWRNPDGSPGHIKQHYQTG